MGSLGDEDSQATTGTSDQYREGREVLEEGSQDSYPRLGHYRAISKKSELNESDPREFELIQPDTCCSASTNKGTTGDEWRSKLCKIELETCSPEVKESIISLLGDSGEDPCCSRVKEYVISLLGDPEENPLHEQLHKWITEVSCERLREILETGSISYPSPVVDGAPRHITTILKVWDECIVSKNPAWARDNS